VHLLCTLIAIAMSGTSRPHRPTRAAPPPRPTKTRIRRDLARRDSLVTHGSLVAVANQPGRLLPSTRAWFVMIDCSRAAARSSRSDHIELRSGRGYRQVRSGSLVASKACCRSASTMGVLEMNAGPLVRPPS
jgi:hypothetical protein